MLPMAITPKPKNSMAAGSDDGAKGASRIELIASSLFNLIGVRSDVPPEAGASGTAEPDTSREVFK